MLSHSWCWLLLLPLLVGGSCCSGSFSLLCQHVLQVPQLAVPALARLDICTIEQRQA